MTAGILPIDAPFSPEGYAIREQFSLTQLHEATGSGGRVFAFGDTFSPDYVAIAPAPAGWLVKDAGSSEAVVDFSDGRAEIFQAEAAALAFAMEIAEEP